MMPWQARDALLQAHDREGLIEYGRRMEMTSTMKRPARTGSPVPAAINYRYGFSYWPIEIGASGTGQVARCFAASVETPAIVALIDSWHALLFSDRPQPWSIPLLSWCQGSAGVVSVDSDYGPLLPHVGSSPLIVDRRSVQRPPRIDARLPAGGLEAPSVPDQLKELQAALSLNKSQLARILQVTRPTIYEWYGGKEPNATNSERIRILLRILARVPVSGTKPLNARFVRQPMGLAESSLLDLLCRDRLDQEPLVRALMRVRGVGDAAFYKRKNREDRLHAIGFEELSREQRKELLARNVALQDWPRR